MAVVLGGYALARFLIEPLRAAEPGGTPPWFDPVMFALVAAAALTWALRRPRAGAEQGAGVAATA